MSDAVPDRRHLRRRLGAARVRARRRGRTPPTSARSRRSPTPTQIRTPLLIQHSRARPPHDDRPGRGAVHGPALAPPAGPAHARARGDPRADPLRHAVPAGREPAPGRATGSRTSWSRAGAACRRCRGSARPLGRGRGRVARVAEVYPRSHDGRATPRPASKAPGADPRLRRARRQPRQPARAGHAGRPGRGRGARRLARSGGRSRRRRSCGPSTSRSG